MDFLLSPGFIIGAIIILFIIIIISLGYVKAPPDQAYIISGPRKNPKILIGRAGVKIPFIERKDSLYLGQITVDIKTENPVPTNDFINVNVDAVAKIRIMADKEINIGTAEEPVMAKGIIVASRNFLNMRPERIAQELQDSLQGNMREIIGTLDLRTINTDRDSFSDQVMEKAQKDMNRLGVEIISCNIQNVTDENGLISDLGADNTSKIKKDAAIAKAQADKEVAIARAQAEKEANEAKVEADTEIAQKNTELEIKKSELKIKSDTKAAEAEAAFNIQNNIQQKAIQTEKVNAEIARAEREAELKHKEVSIKEQTLEAEVKKQADAEKYRLEKQAEAQLIQQQKASEASLFQRTKEAEALEIQAKANAEAKKVEANANAEAIAIEAKAEAEAIAAKGLAEAQAIKAKGLADAEAMEKKAEAYKKYNKVAMVEMLINIMPEMAKSIAEPLSSIDNLNVYSTGGNGNGIESVSGSVPVVMKQLFDTMSDATGVDFADILKSNTIEAKTDRNISINIDNLKTILKGTKGITEEKADSIVQDVINQFNYGEANEPINIGDGL